MSMKTLSTKALLLFIGLIMFSCQKEDEPNDPLLGNWENVSTIYPDGSTIVWEEIKADLIELIPGYSCMLYTCNVNKNTVTVSYTAPDTSTNSCKPTSLQIFTWVAEGSNYTFVQGTNLVKYTITFSNNDNQMRWVDQTDNTVTVWSRSAPQ